MNGSESFFDRIVRTLFGNPGSKKPKKVKPVNTRRLQIEALESREMLAVGPIADVDFPVPVRCDALYNGGISRTEIRSEGTTTTNRRENLSQTLDWSYTYGSNGVTNENFKETYRGDGVATTQYTYDYEMQHVNSAMWYGGSNTSTINVNWTSAEMYCFSTTRTAQNAPLVMSNVFQFITEGYSDTTYDSYNWYLDSNGVTHGSGYSSGTHQSHDNYATRTLNRSPGYWLSYSTPQITYNKCGLPSIKTVTPSGVSGVNGVTEINVAKPNFDNFDPPKVDAILNPPQTVTVTLAAPAEMESPFWVGTKAFCWSFFVSGPANLLKGSYNMAEQMVLTAVDIVGVSVDGIATLASYPLGFEEMSVQGKSWYHSTGLDIAANAARAGLAGGTLGTSEMLIALCGYMNDGDADAFQQHMGGVAAANALVAGGMKLKGCLKTNKPIDPNVQLTLDRISNGKKFPHRNDGTVFRNEQGLLPAKPQGYYREYVHPTPGISGPGKKRIVIGAKGDVWFTTDHYKTFIRLK